MSSNQPKGFIRSHFWTLALLAVSSAVAIYIVKTLRAPGAMTVIEAQAMDMTTSRPPVGVQPVAVEAASLRAIEGVSTFPATIQALSDEEVMSRVPGRLKSVLVYAGDHVRAGQLLATIEADEYAAQAAEAGLMASSKLSMSIASRKEIAESQAMLRSSRSDLVRSKASYDRMHADLEAMALDKKKAESQVAMSQAEIKEREADLSYAEEELGRQEKLYKVGAISLDELQMSRKEREMAKARVTSARASSKAMAQEVEIASRKIDGAKAGIREAKAMVTQAQAMVAQNAAGVEKTKQMARTSQIEAESAKQGARGMSAMAQYRQVRALSDGVVAERMASPGTVVMMGQPLLRLKVVSRVRIQAELPQSIFAKAKVGTPVEIEIEGLEPIEAELTSVSPEVDLEMRSFKVEAIVNNQDGKLASGMYARIHLHAHSAKEALAVQKEAIRTDSNGETYVWLYGETKGEGKETDWTCTMHPEISEKGPGICPKCKMDLVPRSRSGKFAAEKRLVTVGATNGTYTSVLSGLKEGDKVIWAGHENLQPGTPVQETKWGENGPVALPSTTSSSDSEMSSMSNQSDKSDSPKKPVTDVKKEWYCPMGREFESDKPGTCPKCGMDLVKDEEKK